MNKKKTYTIVSLFALVLAVVFLGMGGIILQTPVTINAVTAGNYSGTLMNGGKVLEDQGFLFTIEENRLFRRVTEDGSGKTKIADGATGFLQYVGKNYYYSAENKLYISDLDGTRRELLSYAKHPLVVGSLIYYLNADGMICKTSVTDIDNKKAPKVLNVKPAGDFMVYIQKIYFIGENKRIYTCGAEGEDVSLFLDYPVDAFCLDGQYLYFRSKNKIYAANFQNTVTVKEIVEGDSFIVLGKYILYNTADAFYCLDMNAKASEEQMKNSSDPTEQSRTLHAAKPVKLFDVPCENFGMDQNYCYFSAPNGDFYRVKPGNNQVNKL